MDGAGLYAAYFSIWQQIDPMGTMIVALAGPVVKKDCGGRSVGFSITLSQPATTAGYIVQRIIIFENIKKCDENKICPADKPLAVLDYKPTAEYWEAWEVNPGEIAWPDQAASGLTDSSGNESSPNTCGSDIVWGEFRFYPKAATGNLGPSTRAGITTLMGTQTSPNDPLPVYPGGWTNKNLATRAGWLPSTTIEPTWWKSKPIESASRFVGSYWNCCECDNQYNDLKVQVYSEITPVPFTIPPQNVAVNAIK